MTALPRLTVFALAPLLLTACAGIPRDPAAAPAIDRYLAHAGDPVDRISYPGRLRGWHPVDREHLVIRTGPSSRYLLTVEPGCVGLRQAISLGVTSRAGRNVITSGLDEILLDNDRCRIVEARPLDYEGLRADEQLAGGG